MPRVVDLFAGVGGLSRGFQLAGFDVVGAYEKWDRAARVYSSNFDHDVHLFDLSNVEESIEHVSDYTPDIVVGGPPCQDFSSAGKRRERDNADLTERFAMIAVASQPSAIVMENVPRVESSDAYRRARSIFETHSYNVAELILDASLCGVPQKRKRFFSVALRDGDAQRVKDNLRSNVDNFPMTVVDYMGDEIDTEFYYRHPRNYSRRAIYSIFEPSATIRGVNRPIPPSYPGHPLDAAPLEMARPLLTSERSRIQTFPSDWHWTGSKTDVELMIGNAVPAELARFVANGLKVSL
ncbi:MAG: DNA (cytosine-5-)-methyltransferase [Dehalococcoidia bacterium]|nr:DNA (cytosine-5-)-methyltransferase [Dehalococcoidia bacterium]